LLLLCIFYCYVTVVVMTPCLEGLGLGGPRMHYLESFPFLTDFVSEWCANFTMAETRGCLRYQGKFPEGIDELS
jgi:hypothetical protein